MFLAALALACLAQPTAAVDNPHNQAAECRMKFTPADLSHDCWLVCTSCHEATSPIIPLNIYLDGDAKLCLICHEDKSVQTGGNFLLAQIQGGGGDHPVGIYYDPDSAVTALRDDPKGPLLFVDANGQKPRMHCSTCHDPMGSTPKLLRLGNRHSNLCLACHRK